MKKNKIKEWIKDNKYEIATAAYTTAMIGGTVVFMGLTGKLLWLCIKKEEKALKVDKSIISDLIPDMEKAVVDKSIDRCVIERAYDLGENLSKFVTVNIENVSGD